MALISDITLYDPVLQRQREEELGYHGPIQMWDLDLTYDPTPETWEQAERQDEQSLTIWRFSGTVKYPTKSRFLNGKRVVLEWEDRHTGVHYTHEHHGWACKPDCDKEHGWIEFVNPGDTCLTDEDKPEGASSSEIKQMLRRSRVDNLCWVQEFATTVN